MFPPGDSFPASIFDNWADWYDASVLTDQFPFCGYREVLAGVAALVEPCPGQKVLDLGTGTGNLALLLHRKGCELWCTDFSEPMLAKARLKLPGARFFLHDLHDPLPVELECPFDRIVSAYVFHHFELDEKVGILRSLFDRHLAPAGRIVIGDIAFQSRAALDRVRAELGDAWEDEYYWLADETIPALVKAGIGVEYRQVSTCAGIFVLTR